MPAGIEPERLQFTSLLVLYNNVLQSLFQSQIMTLGAVFVAIGLMFWILFRSLSLALLALAPNILAAGLVLGLMGPSAPAPVPPQEYWAPMPTAPTTAIGTISRT